MYIWWLLKFVAFLWKAHETVPTCWLTSFQLVSQQSLASTINKKPNILRKWPSLATTVLSGMNTIIEALVYWGITSVLRSRPKQSHYLSGALLPQWLQVVYRVFNGRSHLQLYRKCHLNSLFMNIFWDYSKKGSFNAIYPFGCGVYLSGDICWMHWAD